MITFHQRGNFSKTNTFLERLKELVHKSNLDKYGEMGVEALMLATPIDSGKTASSWYYKIEHEDGRSRIIFCNSNINKDVPIAIILQYGHGTGTGGWVEGIDYINPSMKSVFEKLAADAWSEVINL